MLRPRSLLTLLVPLAAVLAACGSEFDDGGSSAPDEAPTIVVTTNILGDVVDELVGDQADVVTIMPVGTDPHEFQPSAREVERLQGADALIVNGAGLEHGLDDVIDGARADGVPTFEAISAVETIPLGAETHGEVEDDGDDGQDEDQHGADHAGDDVDPHFFTDPSRMIDAAEGIVAFLDVEVEALDADRLATTAAAYLDELAEVDVTAEEELADIPAENRLLVTNHEVLGYFADRYDFEIVGTVVPTGSTADAVSVDDLADLVEAVRAAGAPAVFADTSAPDRLAATLADEVGDVAVVELYTESLGAEGSPAGTYLDMVRTNAERVADALS